MGLGVGSNEVAWLRMSRREPAPAGVPARRRMLQSLRPAMEHPLRVLACTLGWLVAPGCGGDEAPESRKPPTPKATVEVVTLAPEELRNIVEIPGQLESEQTVWVRSEIEGVLASIDFEEGQQVEAGKILFQLRDDEQRARLRESEAELALAQDVFQRTKKLASKHVSSGTVFHSMRCYWRILSK